jgi:dGTPase
MLRPFASDPGRSRGRRHSEPETPGRTAYQCDRERIVHCTAFRRLVYKTQVFLNHEGDLFRTRLTHSLEVAQLGRSLARHLGLNEDLVEAISLAHDLGHTPFGHAGQEALNECVDRADPALGGFEHNLQSLRIVDQLEQHFPDFEGLNLSFETREGVLKHCSIANARRLLDTEPAGVAQRFVDRTQPSLEAQLCNLADQLAYNAHDIDDGIRSGLMSVEHLDALPILVELRSESLLAYPKLRDRRLVSDVLRRLMARQIRDVVDVTTHGLSRFDPVSSEAARHLPAIVRMSDAAAEESARLKTFLRTHLYRHPRIVETTDLAKQVVRDLFQAYCEHTDAIEAATPSGANVTQCVADYVAGMTDRFALREHERITGRRLIA